MRGHLHFVRLPPVVLRLPNAFANKIFITFISLKFFLQNALKEPEDQIKQLVKTAMIMKDAPDC